MCLGGDLVAKLCLTLATPWNVACQAPLSMAFSRQEYWRGFTFPSHIYICILFFIFSYIIHYYKILNTVPFAIQWVPFVCLSYI